MSFYVKRAAVLGAGVMGAQIAAHLVNAGVETILFELPAEGKDPNANVNKALKQLTKLQPSPLSVPEVAGQIIPANYQTDLEKLAECDLVIEAIAERMDWKKDLYGKVGPHIGDRAIFASNTSGLSINELAATLPGNLRPRFCGVHFFNPPRYMRLVEIIPGEQSDPNMLDALESFLTTYVGKGVIRAKDTPNFIANRIGVFSMLATMHHAQAMGIPFDVVDALTGPAIGRPKSATFRTADVVGLDTLAHVVNGSAAALQDDPWIDYLKIPDWLQALIDKGALGQKTRAGVYRKEGKQILVLDLDKQDYRPSEGKAADEVAEILKMRDPAKKFAALKASDHPQAQFLWAIHRDVFHYAAYLLEQIADNARDLDLAIRWGFGWSMGPFEVWQAAGWKQVADWMAEDIAAGKTMASAALPDWVSQIDGVHRPDGSYAPADGSYRGKSDLPVYQRQLFPEAVITQGRQDKGETVWESDEVRLWTLDGEIGILSIKTKMHAIGREVLDGIMQAVAIAEEKHQALVVWNPDEPFSAGANLSQVVQGIEQGEWEMLDNMVAQFQAATGSLQKARVPVVGAPRGLALGGGCEFLMHCDQVVAGLESYIGLVEVGVGLIPAGGGCKEFATRAAALAPDGDPFPFIRRWFETVAMGKVAKSAGEAKAMGYLRDDAIVVMHPDEQLHVALETARAMAARGYRPALPRKVKVAGRQGISTLKMMLVNMQEGGFISEYDYQLGCAVAEALCGGDVETGTEVDETWLLQVEWRLFTQLMRQEKTQARIGHMLKTGKPLRN